MFSVPHLLLLHFLHMNKFDEFAFISPPTITEFCSFKDSILSYEEFYILTKKAYIFIYI